MQTIIKFLANGGKVHVSFVTFLHFLDLVSFKLISDWPAVATTNVNATSIPSVARPTKISQNSYRSKFKVFLQPKNVKTGHTGKRNLKPKPDRNFSA